MLIVDRRGWYASAIASHFRFAHGLPAPSSRATPRRVVSLAPEL